MNSITRYSPAFCEMDDDYYATVEFETREDLEKVEWVRQRTTDPDFLGFATGDRTMLFAYYSDGKHWGVGRLGSVEGLGYPTLKELGR